MAAAEWPAGFYEVEIPNPTDGVVQKAYMRSASRPGQPLAVVLHTWSGDYAQRLSSLVEQVQERDWNYIHPDFRGPNRQPEACCSPAALSDLDAAVQYALQATGADPRRVHVVGSSGGGYATLCFFMKTRLEVASFSAWVPVTDLVAWHAESKERGNGYDADIRRCTGAGEKLDIEEARRRSPLYMPTPTHKLDRSLLRLYAGIRDGHKGSVPVSHSLRFYVKVLEDLGVRNADAFISEADIVHLVNTQSSPDSATGWIGNRRILYRRSHGNVTLTVFDGAHEMLSDVAFEGLR